MSTIFLIIFIGIFVFGIYRQRKCTEFLRASSKILSRSSVTVRRVHDKYTREEHKIRSVINQINGMLSTIESNAATVNQEFSTEQKRFVDSWNIVMNKISETMTYENERLNAVHMTLENGAQHSRYLRRQSKPDKRAYANTTDNFKTTTENLMRL